MGRVDATLLESALRVRDLRMRYGEFDAVRGISFEVRPGEVLVLLGPNGAGKSTTIEVLEGFRRRTGGEVDVLGSDPAQVDDAWRARIGIVLQSWRDHGKWRVRELLDHMGGYYSRYSTADRRRPRDIDELLGALGLTDHADKRVSKLSGGQRRRLDVAVGIVGNPELLFLDEPTAGLDPEARHEFHGLVQELAASDTTIILTTHDLAEAEKLADRIIILAAGHIVADGTAAELATKVAAQDQVSWSRDGESYRESTSDSSVFVSRLFETYGSDIRDLSVHRADLESVYLTLVREAEAGNGPTGLKQVAEVSR